MQFRSTVSLSVTLILFVVSSLTAKNNFKKVDPSVYPSYEKIVYIFFNNYSGDELLPTDKIRFIKDSEGWKVALRDYYTDTLTTQPELFWSLKKRRFGQLVNIKKEDGITPNQAYKKFTKFVTSYDSYSYNANIFYGYEGALEDIDAYCQSKGVDKLNSFELNSLARSYSSFYTRIFPFDTENNLKNGTYKDPKNISQEDLNQYLKYAELSILTYKKIVDKDPEFETIVGNIRTKWANEHMTAYYELAKMGKQKEANTFLKKGIYSPGMIEIAKNMLNSCATNGILFVGGDSDTYPLWYVQLSENFRTDIRVINTSLLNTGSFINMLKKNSESIKPVKISMPESSYMFSESDFARISNGQLDETGLNVRDFIQLVQDKNEDNLEYSGENKIAYLNFKTKRFKLPVNKPAVMASGMLTLELHKEMSDTIDWNIMASYLEQKHIIMLDIIQANNWERPVYFSSTIAPNDFMNLENYFQLEGMVYRLTPVDSKLPNRRVATALTYEVMMEKMNFRQVNASIIGFNSNIRDKFYELAKACYENQENEKAVKILNYSLEQIPDEKVPYDATISSYIELLAKLGEKEKARSIMVLMHQRYVKQLNVFLKKDLEEYQLPEYRFKILPAVFGLSRFAALSKEYFPDLHETINKDNERYYSTRVVLKMLDY